jgi:hypothetical protein
MAIPTRQTAPKWGVLLESPTPVNHIRKASAVIALRTKAISVDEEHKAFGRLRTAGSSFAKTLSLC